MAWLTPRPTNRDAALTDCFNRPPTELEYWLGDRFDESLDESLAVRSRDALLALGPAWLDAVQQDRAVQAY